MDKHIKICKYEVITCKYCKDWILRQDMNNHYMICLRYPLQCNQCDMSIPRCFLLKHMSEECKLSKINCPKCNKIIVRKDKESHLKTECSDRLMRCKYYKLGCDEMIKQNELQYHMEQSIDYHLHLLQIAQSTHGVDSKYKQLIKELKRKKNTSSEPHAMQDIEFGFDAIDMKNRH